MSAEMAVGCSASVLTISACRHGIGHESYMSKVLPAAGLRQRRHVHSQPIRGAEAWLVTKRQRFSRTPRALFGGGGGGGSGEQEKKFISKDEEPEQYWQTADEKAGKGPMSSPLPYIALLGVLSPFIILGIAFANNWIKIPVR